MKDINAEAVLAPLFQERKKQTKKVFIQYGDKVFVHKTTRGDHWLYRGPGTARRALIECLYYETDCPLKIQSSKFGYDYKASMKNIEQWEIFTYNAHCGCWDDSDGDDYHHDINPEDIWTELPIKAPNH